MFDVQQDDRPGATMPAQGTCPACGKVGSWLDALKNAGNVGWKRSGRRQARSVLTAAYWALSLCKTTAKRKRQVHPAISFGKPMLSCCQMYLPASRGQTLWAP